MTRRLPVALRRPTLRAVHEDWHGGSLDPAIGRKFRKELGSLRLERGPGGACSVVSAQEIAEQECVPRVWCAVQADMDVCRALSWRRRKHCFSELFMSDRLCLVPRLWPSPEADALEGTVDRNLVERPHTYLNIDDVLGWEAGDSSRTYVVDPDRRITERGGKPSREGLKRGGPVATGSDEFDDMSFVSEWQASNDKPRRERSPSRHADTEPARLPGPATTSRCCTALCGRLA
jgi:hypothetical protein